jgi:hypothetical protein
MDPISEAISNRIIFFIMGKKWLLVLPLYIFQIGTKIRGMVTFVLEQLMVGVKRQWTYL